MMHLMFFSDEAVSKIMKTYISIPIPPKGKEAHFKTMNEIYTSNEFLRMKFNVNNNCCNFCISDVESTDRLFYCFNITLNSWSHLND